MSEFKFACPVCGQHITCDSTSSGSQMDCPTCFRRIVIPHAPSDSKSTLVMTASEANRRPKTSLTAPDRQLTRRKKSFPVVPTVAAVLLLALAAGAVVLREKLFSFRLAKPTANEPAYQKPSLPDTNWSLKLGGRTIPDAPVSGRIHGRPFTLSRTTVQGGTLTFRQGAKWPPDLGLTVHLFAKQGADLAGKSVSIDPMRTNAPKLTLRWKDEQGKAVTRTIREGYALRVEFGPVTGGQLPGRIYLCVPDEESSWIAGSFSAEIRKPQATKMVAMPASNSPPH